MPILLMRRFSRAAAGKGLDISKKARVEEIVEPVSEYHYAAFDTQNPFKAPKLSPDLIVEEQKKIYEIPIVSELQKYRLEELAVKGIWQKGDGERKAIIMTPTNAGVVVKIGDPISVGKIIKIEKDHIMARQYRLNVDGSREYADKKLYLGEIPQDVPSIQILEPGKDPILKFELPESLGNRGKDALPSAGLKKFDERGAKPAPVKDLLNPTGDQSLGNPTNGKMIENYRKKESIETSRLNTADDPDENDGDAATPAAAPNTMPSLPAKY